MTVLSVLLAKNYPKMPQNMTNSQINPIIQMRETDKTDKANY